MSKIYDYTIVGNGPCGLTIAYILSTHNKKVLVIGDDAVGGCHRVRRVDGYFTEHGPRIYSDSYVNTIALLNSMGINFYDYFTPYNFSMSRIGGENIFNFKVIELFWLTYEFIRLMFNPQHGKSITCLEFMNKHHFTDKTIDYIDRLCRLTDGAGADKYTLHELLQLVNQNAFYKIYQPNKPNDVGLFKTIKKKLKNVDFVIGHVTKLFSKNNFITNIELIGDKKMVLNVKNCILAIPPVNLMNILFSSNNLIKNAFGKFDKVYKWTMKNRYNMYIPIVFHWNKKLNLPKVYGFPKTEWGIAFIVLTDYMTFKKSRTVISTTITIMNKKSLSINKYPDECTKQELIEQVFEQLKQSFPTLENPTKAILSPANTKINNKWHSIDDAYMMTTDSGSNNYIPIKSSFNNLYSIGTHSGKHIYSFTSMESAVTNGIYLSNLLTGKKFPIKSPFTIRHVFLLIVIIIVFQIWNRIFSK